MKLGMCDFGGVDKYCILASCMYAPAKDVYSILLLTETASWSQRPIRVLIGRRKSCSAQNFWPPACKDILHSQPMFSRLHTLR